MIIEEPSLIKQNNIFSIISSLKKSMGQNSKSGMTSQTKIKETNHLKTGIRAFDSCLKLLKSEILENLKPILVQIRIYKQEALKTAYRRQFKALVRYLMSCYENLSFLNLLNQDLYRAVTVAKEGLAFLGNIERGFVGFASSVGQRLKLDFNMSLGENLKNFVPTSER